MDVDDGPCRRVLRSKRRTSSLDTSPCINKENQKTLLKSRKRRRSSGVSELDTSDALLADIDLDKISQSGSTTQQISANHKQAYTQGVRGSLSGITLVTNENEIERNPDDLIDEDVIPDDVTNMSICTTQSQYFSSRFSRYKATQPKGKPDPVNKDKEGPGGREHLGTSQRSARNGDPDTTLDQSGKDLSYELAGRLSDRNWNNSQVLNCSAWKSKEIISSTQLDAVDNHDQTGPCSKGFRCTPFERGTRDMVESQISQTSVQECDSVDVTLLKDDVCSRVKYRCTPFKSGDLDMSSSSEAMYRSNAIDSQQDQSLQSSLENTQSDTLLKSQNHGNSKKFRCTPYNACMSKDLGTQTQTQLVSNTQYHETLLTPGFHGDKMVVLDCDRKNMIGTQELRTQPGTSQTQVVGTGMCDMTGLIIDSQVNNQDLDTSDCDIFGDSFTDQDLLTQGEALDKNRTDLHNKECSNKPSSIPCLNEPQTISDKNGKHLNSDTYFNSILTNNSLNVDKNVCIGKMDIEKSNSSTGNHHIEQSSSNMCTADTLLVDAKAVSYSSKGISPALMLETSENNEKHPGSLQERIKQRLQENKGQRSSVTPGRMVEQIREQVLQRVMMEAEMGSSTSDIGPFYGLPSKVQHMFENYRGIKKLYAWQEECLGLPAVKERRNLIYCLPTSGGKTLVAEILILQALLCHRQDALLILPFVSIVQEKVRNMSQFAIDLNFHVEEYAGSKGRFPPTKRRNNQSLYIATIEKGHSIINSLIESDRMASLGLVVVDECHMLGEGGSRGATLECTLLKILQASGPTQIIGMSATLNNIADLKLFLNAEVYTNDFRPVKLTEHIKLSDNIFSVQPGPRCEEERFKHDRIVCFQYRPDMEKTDPDHILGLALEVIPAHSCLVFCPTKKNCENVALMLCKLMAKYRQDLKEVKRDERHKLLKELCNDNEGRVCPVLKNTIHFGVAYHHSGLTMDERKLIEEAYAGGTLCLLTCTSTLAAGVNLPAKRVILRSPYVGQCFISRSQYKQMVGRAGRAGIDDSGESIMICKSSDREKVSELLAGPVENCHSSLMYDAGKGLRTLLLSTIGLKVTTSTEDVFGFVQRSLCQIQQEVLGVDLPQVCREALQRLIDTGLVIQTKSAVEEPEGTSPVHSLEVTELGRATFKGPVDVDYAAMLYEDLKRAEEPLVISTHLHLLYLVTPYDVVKDINPDWYIYFNQMNSLTASELKVASVIGVPESYIARKASQQKSKMKVDEFVLKRFYLTLMLYEIWKQRSVWEVADRFQQQRGFIQNLFTSAASFASCVAHFCEEMKEFWAYQDLMGNFVKRLSYCVTAELIPLMEIPGVKLGRARLMYHAGYQSLSSVASADPEDLVKAVTFMPRKVAQQVVASAKLLLSEKTEMMLEEVEQLVTVPALPALTMATTGVPASPSLSTPSFSQASTGTEGAV